MGDDMPDFSLKLPNLTADISWSWRINDSIEFDDIAFLPFGLSVGRRRGPPFRLFTREGDIKVLEEERTK